jgi:hypothetical protein
MGALRPSPPTIVPRYYLVLTVAPYIRRHRKRLSGFGHYWHRVRPLLTTMNDLQRMDLKLRLMDAWMSANP